MKFTCSKDIFEYTCASCERFIGKNINLPILSSFFIETTQSTIVVTATNLEYAIQISLPAKIYSQGSVCVPARIITQYIQSIKEETIECEGKQNTLVIKTPSREGKINGMNPEDFPIIPKIKKTSSYTEASLPIIEAFGLVLPAVSTSEFKPELNGVFVSIRQGETLCAATDTFRLAEKKIKKERGRTEEKKEFILPMKIAQEIVRVFGEEDQPITFSFGENQIEITTKQVHIFSRLIEGAFPEYSAIIPKTFSTSVFLPKNEIINGVRASSIFASKLQDVEFRFSQKKLEIVSENTEIGLTKISLPIAMSGKPLTISFNHRFLLDGLLAVQEDEVFFGANEPNTPVFLRNKSDTSFTYVVMPIRAS